MQNVILFLVVVLFCKYGYSEENTESPVQVYNIPELKEDFQVWRSTLERTHANLYLYVSKSELNKTFDSFYVHIDTSMTALEFYSYITPLVSVIKDGHNYIHPNKELTGYYDKNALFFPFHVVYLNKKLLIDMNLSPDSTIKDGTEILSINGISSEQVMNELLKRQPRDGFNETYPLWILNNWFREYYSYVFGHPSTFSLSIKTPDNSILNKEINALSKDSILHVRKKLYAERVMVNENKKAIVFKTIDSSKVGILTIYTFSHKMKKQYHQSYKREIKSVFAEMKHNKTEQLILDLRNNQGGASEYGSNLLSFLLDKPFTYIKELYAVKRTASESEEGRLKKMNVRSVKQKKPKSNPFSGDVFLLINGGSFSNSGILSSCLETHKRAIIIGEEAGGNKTVLTSEFSISPKTTLPNTKIICDKPDYRTVIRDIASNDGHGVFPEFKVVPTVDDIIKNKDVVMEKAFELMKKVK